MNKRQLSLAIASCLMALSVKTANAQRENFSRVIPDPPTENEILIALIQNGEVSLCDEVFFQFDSTEFAAGTAGKQLAIIARVLDDPRLRNHRFVIEGHTCDLGEADYNQNLSEKRAKRVVKVLVEEGISPKRLEALGYGETRALAEHTVNLEKDDKEMIEFKRQMNRRVIIRKLR